MKSVVLANSLDHESSLLITEALKDLSAHGTPIYQRREQTLYRFQVGSLDLIAKHYQIKTLPRAAAAMLGKSRARRSFQAARRLLDQGIPTPDAIFLLEQGRIFPEDAFLVTEYFPGLTLLEFLRNEKDPPAPVITAIVAIFRRLLHSQNRHGDFHCQNVLVNKEEEITLIDLDGARQRFSKARLRKNLQTDRDRLVNSLFAYPDFQTRLIEALGKPKSPFPEL